MNDKSWADNVSERQATLRDRILARTSRQATLVWASARICLEMTMAYWRRAFFQILQHKSIRSILTMG